MTDSLDAFSDDFFVNVDVQTSLPLPTSRETILQTVWGFQKDVEANTLEAFVRLLRNKIDQGHPRKLIHTIRGVGYCLREEAE